MGHVAQNVKKHDLIELFKKYGDITEIMMKDDFAFVEFAHIHSAAKALSELNGARLMNQKIQVEEARPKDGEQAQVSRHTFKQTSGNSLLYGQKDSSQYVFFQLTIP